MSDENTYTLEERVAELETKMFSPPRTIDLHRLPAWDRRSGCDGRAY